MGQRPPKIRESAVASQCVDWLRIHGCRPERRNVGGFWYDPDTGAFHREKAPGRKYVAFARKGMTDYYYILNNKYGTHVDLEIKRPGERPKPHQIEEMIAVNESTNAYAFWVDSFDLLRRVHGRLLQGWKIFMFTNGDYDIGNDGPPR